MNDRQKDHLFGLLERMLRLQLLMVKRDIHSSEEQKVVKEVEEYINQ